MDNISDVNDEAGKFSKCDQSKAMARKAVQWFGRGTVIATFFLLLISTNGVLWPVHSKAKIGRMPHRGQVRRVVNCLYSSALFVVMKNFRVEHISVLDPAPDQNFRLVRPVLYQRFNWNCDVSGPAHGSGPHYGGLTRCISLEHGTEILIHRKLLPLHPNPHVGGRSHANILNFGKYDVLLDALVNYVGARTKALPEEKSATLSSGDVLRTFYKFHRRVPEERSENSKRRGDHSEPDGRKRYSPLLPRLIVSILLFFSGCFLAFIGGHYLHYNRRRFAASLYCAAALLGLSGFACLFYL